MRILVFCGTYDSVCKFHALDGWRGATATFSPNERREAIRGFQNTENAKLAVDRSYIVGWRAPAGTFVLFDPSWPYAPNSPESIQAVARVAV